MWRRLVVAAACLLAARLVLALLLIPPWQQPDEPAHVAVAEVFRHRLASRIVRDPGREAEIIQSMAWHDWWGHYGAPTPDPLPARFVFAGDTLGVDPTSPNYARPYYTAAAIVLSVASRRTVVEDMYLMRVLSALVALVTLWVAWRGARAALGDVGGITVAALLAFHPQFAVVSTTASPDALVNLAAACFWWQGIVALRGPRLAVPLAAAWIAAAVAAAVDRAGVPLVVGAFGMSMIVIARRTRSLAWAVPAGIAGAAVAGGVLWLVDLSRRTFTAALWTQIAPVPAARTWEFFSWFATFLFSSWWLSLGWIRYRPEAWWMAVPVLLFIATMVGVTRRLRRDGDSPARAVILSAMLVVGVQVAAVYWTYFRMAGGPQGRHLFPAFVPALVLLWIGIEEAVPLTHRRYAAAGLIGLFAFLDLTAWLLIALPAYGG